MPSAIPLGDYYLVACADDKKTVAESGEDDNCMAAASQELHICLLFSVRDSILI